MNASNKSEGMMSETQTMLSRKALNIRALVAKGWTVYQKGTLAFALELNEHGGVSDLHLIDMDGIEELLSVGLLSVDGGENENGVQAFIGTNPDEFNRISRPQYVPPERPSPTVEQVMRSSGGKFPIPPDGTFDGLVFIQKPYKGWQLYFDVYAALPGPTGWPASPRTYLGSASHTRTQLSQDTDNYVATHFSGSSNTHEPLRTKLGGKWVTKTHSLVIREGDTVADVSFYDDWDPL